MRFENSTPPHDLSPAIDPGVEKVTGALFHRLHRVIIEVKAPGGSGGYRKLNAISLEDLPVAQRSSEREDELNAAIMLVALSHVAESGESTRFRARYMSMNAEGDAEVRNYVRFKVASDEEQSEGAGLDLGLRSSDKASGIEQLLPLVQWLVSMFETREQVLIAYNEGLTDKLLKSSAQAEPLLRAQGTMASLFEQGLIMAYQGSAAQGALAGMQTARPGVPEAQKSDGLSEVLKPGLEMAFSQFIKRGKSSSPPGASTSAPGTASSSERASDSGSAGAAGAESVRFSSGPQANPKVERKEKVNAEVVVEPAEPVDPIVQTIALWLGSMDGSQTLALTKSLSPGQRESLQAVSSAKTDEEAAKAVLELQAGLVTEGNGMDLLGLLDPSQRNVLMTIQAMAQRHSES